MTDLVRDYLALPQVVFWREHWVATLIWLAACLVMGWLASKIGRR